MSTFVNFLINNTQQICPNITHISSLGTPANKISPQRMQLGNAGSPWTLINTKTTAKNQITKNLFGFIIQIWKTALFRLIANPPNFLESIRSSQPPIKEIHVNGRPITNRLFKKLLILFPIRINGNRNFHPLTIKLGPNRDSVRLCIIQKNLAIVSTSTKRDSGVNNVN